MNNTICILSASIILTAMAASAPASAAEVGRVMFANGDVRIVAANGNSRAAIRGEAVQSGERIQTGTGALGQVKMRDGGRLSVRGDSEVRFDPTATTGAKRQQLILESGNVRVLNIAQNGAPDLNAVEIKTPAGDLLMQEGDLVVANLGRRGGANTLERVVVRVDKGTASMAIKGAAGAQQLALAAGNPITVSSGTVEQIDGRLGGFDQSATASAPLRPSDGSNEKLLGANSLAGAAEPIVTPGQFIAPEVALPSPNRGLRFAGALSPLAPRADTPSESLPALIVPSTQLTTVLADRPPSIELPKGTTVNPINRATAAAAIDRLTIGQSAPAVSGKTKQLIDASKSPNGRARFTPIIIKP